MKGQQQERLLDEETQGVVSELSLLISMRLASISARLNTDSGLIAKQL